MKITLDIKEEKLDFFMELIQNLNFVSPKTVKREKRLLVKDIEEAVINVYLAKQGKLRAKPIKELLDEV